ncbi:MAG: hypothetical protein WCD89_18775 [Anaerocolumna sp.]
MKEKDNRVLLLEQYCNMDSDRKIILDKTPQSLTHLWEWFESHIEWEDKKEEEIQKDLELRPQWMHEYILQATDKISIRTMALASDIATYYGETLIKNNPQIKWGYKLKPDKLDGVKKPILLGYKGNLSCDPRTIIDVLIRKSSREKCGSRLYDAYIKELKLIN